MAIDQARIPTPIRRRAAQHLESIRGTPMAPFGDGATLGNDVWPIYRPDLEEVAYYEFTVELGSKARQLVTSAAGRRSEERRVGKECEDLCRSRWSPYH